LIGKHASIVILRKYRIGIVTGLITGHGIVASKVILVVREKRSLPIVTVDVGIDMPVSI
jgi:hypothetical protein